MVRMCLSTCARGSARLRGMQMENEGQGGKGRRGKGREGGEGEIFTGGVMALNGLDAEMGM